MEKRVKRYPRNWNQGTIDAFESCIDSVRKANPVVVLNPEESNLMVDTRPVVPVPEAIVTEDGDTLTIDVRHLQAPHP